MTPLEDATDADDPVGLDPAILWHGAARRVPLGASPPPPAPSTGSVAAQPGRSVNRNRSVQYFGYLINSVPTATGTDRFLRKYRTEEFRFRVIRFGFGSNRRNRKNSK